MSEEQLAWLAAHHTPWYERIGDPGPVGWITAAAYLVAAALCALAARKGAALNSADCPLWLGAACILLVLGINKQADLQVGLVELWRNIALAQGWYGARRAIQFATFIAGLAGGAAALAWLVPKVRRGGRAIRWALAGMIVIGFYVNLRAAKFQHIAWDDPLLPTAPGWFSAIELCGIAIVAASAFGRMRSNAGAN